MSADEPPIVKLSERRRQLAGQQRQRKRPQDYSGFSEYFAAEIEPNLKRKQPALPPQANLGYPAMKRRR